MVTIRPLSTTDFDEAKKIWELRFHDSLSFIDWFFTNRFSPETSFCAVEDGHIVSIAHGFLMQLRIRGVILPSLMVSGVATMPGYEGRGLMKQVLYAQFLECRKRGIPLAFHHPSHFSIYRAIGEYPCYDALFHTRECDPPTPVSWDAVPSASALLSVYEQATNRYNGCVIRSVSDMENRILDLTSDGTRFLLHTTGGLPDGYLFATLEKDGTLYCEETLAASSSAYTGLVSRLPRNTVVKLPPDIPLPGQLTPWGVIIPIDVPLLLRALCIEPTPSTIEVFDETLPWNNGVFDCKGNRVYTKPAHSLSTGRLMQFLCGYLPFPNLFSEQICYCADEY
ncbi:MAG: GNAT family N-acetyltransferase [Eubacteriales bacterium]|nr:GNAT family N-acetyltransferase [Eubacteriales bacterium]